MSKLPFVVICDRRMYVNIWTNHSKPVGKGPQGGGGEMWACGRPYKDPHIRIVRLRIQYTI